MGCVGHTFVIEFEPNKLDCKKLDILINEKLFGVHIEITNSSELPIDNIPYYSTNLLCANKVMEKLIEITKESQPRINVLYTYKGRYTCHFSYSIGEIGSGEFEDHIIITESDTMAYAICLAAKEFLYRSGIIEDWKQSCGFKTKK